MNTWGRRPRNRRPYRDSSFDSTWIYVHSSDTSRDHIYGLTGMCWCDPLIEATTRSGEINVIHEGCGLDA